MTFTLTELLESQISKKHDYRIAKRWKAIRDSVNRLYDLCPDRFEAEPSPVGFRAEIFAPGNNAIDPSNWGFNKPLDMDAETFVKTFRNDGTRTIDLSALVAGAKKETFVHHFNIRPKGSKNDPLDALSKLRKVLRKALTQKGFENEATIWVDKSATPSKVYRFNSPQEVLALYRTKKRELG